MGCSASKQPVLVAEKSDSLQPCEDQKSRDHTPTVKKNNNNKSDINGECCQIMSSQLESPQENRESTIILDGSEEGKPRSISVITDDGVGDIGESEGKLLEDVINIHMTVNDSNVNENVLVQLILSKPASYRQLLRSTYMEKYDENLVKVLKRCTCGDVQYFLTSMLYTTDEFIAIMMRQYIDEKNFVKLAEILTAWSSSIVNNGKKHYFEMFELQFSQDISTGLGDQVSKSLKDIMIQLSTLNRNEHDRELENKNLIEEAANNLSQGPEEILETLTRKSYSRATLAAIFEEYKLRYYLDIVDIIDIEFHDESQKVLSCIVKSCENITSYFTSQLTKAIDDKNEKDIINILIGRNTIDLASIATEYKNHHDKTLQSAVLKVCSDKNKALLKIFFANHLK